jgi:hypothetical protein
MKFWSVGQARMSVANGNGPVGHVMGRLRLGYAREGSILAAINEDIAIADAGMEF